MAKQSSVKSADIAERGVQYTKDQFGQAFDQADQFVRENPGRSIAYAFLIGFIMNRLPVGRVLGGCTRLLMVALKPAVLTYGALKLYQAAQNNEKLTRSSRG